jgi:elongation factor Ts
MADINAALVKKLRDMTGAGMGACKKALVASEGDLEKAADLLRAQGVKADQLERDASEGAILLKTADDGKGVAIVELRCETDFAAKSENFQKLLKAVADAVLEHKTTNAADTKAIAVVSSGLQEAGAVTIRENVVLAQAEYRALDGEGKIGTYTHHNGKVGVAIAVNTSSAVCGKGELDALLRDLAMHATAHVPNPVAVDKDSVPVDLVEREKKVALQTIDQDPKLSDKSDEIKQKMVDGKLRKFFEERALLEQKFVKDPSQTVNDLLTKHAKQLGGEIKVAWFVRQAVG